jgi:hypothetical protein
VLTIFLGVTSAEGSPPKNPRVTRVIAVNPYDYWPAGGIRKSSLAARLVLTPSGVPVLGATIMRLRNRFVSDRIFEGGLASPGQSSKTHSSLRQRSRAL